MTGPAARDELRAGFDRSAGQYDREAGENPAMQYMRRVSLHILTCTFSPGQRILEIGCGTGEEAVALGQRGIQVLATDLSAEMLSVARARIAAAGLEKMVQLEQVAAGEIGALAARYGEGSLDGAYSSFGALNGEPDLRTVGRALRAIVAPGGSLVVSVMNRFYPFEVLWYLGHGQLRRAVRRWPGKAVATVSANLPVTVPTWYYGPRDLIRAFAGFRPVHCRALPLLLPPPYAAHLWARFPGPIGRLTRWEERLAVRWPCSLWGDHTLMVLQRQ